jgi:hypothetical protein
MNNKAVYSATTSASDPRPEISASPRDSHSQIDRLAGRVEITLLRLGIL